MNIVQWPTRNFGYPQGTHGRNGEQIVAIVDHIMEGNRAGYHSYLADSNRNSANFSVYKDGHVEQHVPIADAAWCNGQMHGPNLSIPWIKRCFDQNINPNLVTVSIEHEGYSGMAWPAAQVAATIALHKYLRTKCPKVTADRQHIVGHLAIDSVNKPRCPGTQFPWIRLMAGIKPAPLPPAVDWTGIGTGVRVYCKAHGLTPRPEPALRWFDVYHDEYLWVKGNAAHPHGGMLTYRASTGEIGGMWWSRSP